MPNAFIDTAWEASRQGALKLVIDTSSCAYALKGLRPYLTPTNRRRYDRLTILDAVDFLYGMILPGQPDVIKKKSIVLHPVCAIIKMDSQEKFFRLAEYCAEKVTVPLQTGCCGMAGDRGFLFPELTASATLPEALEVSRQAYDGYYSSTRTSEIAMSQSVNKNYESILYLLDEVVP